MGQDCNYQLDFTKLWRKRGKSTRRKNSKREERNNADYNTVSFVSFVSMLSYSAELATTIM
jgi:hypothetical protein